jgi:hypothetical protein
VFSVLSKNQRTCVFKYADNLKEHPVLKDFPKEIYENFLLINELFQQQKHTFFFLLLLFCTRDSSQLTAFIILRI